MIGYYDYTVIITYLGLASGVTGIYTAIKDKPTIAIVFLMLAGLCDMLDGVVARTKERTENEKKFGIQIDSLADLVCYGVLPTVIGYSIGLQAPIWQLLFIAYVLAALIRLAYFNVMEEQRQTKTKEARKEYLGLPVTSVAIILPLVYSLKIYVPTFFPYIYAGTLLLAAIAFLTKFTLKKLKKDGMILMVLIGIIELLLLFLQR